MDLTLLRSIHNKSYVPLVNSELFIKFIRKTIGIACLAICLISCSSKNMELSEKSRSEIEQEIQQSFDGLVEASKALDVTRYFEFIDAEKFVGLKADGTNWNSIVGLRELIEPGFNSVEKIESLIFTNVRISVIDLNTAILVNEYEQKIILKGGAHYNDAGGGTQVWSKASGKWLLVSISASSKP